VELPQDSDDEQTAHLLVALEHRTVLGQATGIVMERYRVDADAAFRVLLRISSETQTKVYKIAQQLVEERHVAGL
jgi:AmiR/NasT family two-component response regulator